MQQLFLDQEKEVLKKLEANYQDALSEINSKIELLMARQDADMQHVIYQVEYQKALKDQVSAILEQLHNNEFETVSEYLAQSYEDGFIGTMYDLQGQGIPLIIPLDQEQVAAAIQHETKLSESLYMALGRDTKDLSKKIAGEISRGISNAAMYSEIARNIAAWGRIPKNNAMRIVRTEAHRIQIQATADAQWKAKENGADVVKQWDSSMDKKTRKSHRELDGQIRELDEPFEINGHKAMQPGGFGRPEEDINCRCALLQRARWALGNDYTKWSEDAPIEIADDGTSQLAYIPAKNYKDFKEQYNRATERVRGNVQKINDENADIKSYKDVKRKYQEEKRKLNDLEKECDDLLYAVTDAIGTEKEDELNKIFEKKYDEVESFKERLEEINLLMKEKAPRALKGLEKEINSKYSFTQNASLDGMSFEAAEQIANTYQKVFDKFPELIGKLNGFELKRIDDMNDYAQAVHSQGKENGRIYLNKMYFDTESGLNAITEKLAEDVLQQYHPISADTFESIIVHELGHSIDSYLSENGHGGIGNKVQQNIILRELGIDTRDTKAIKEGLSGYANTNGAEFMSEGFSEYILSENPRKIANAIGELFKRKISKI